MFLPPTIATYSYILKELLPVISSLPLSCSILFIALAMKRVFIIYSSASNFINYIPCVITAPWFYLDVFTLSESITEMLLTSQNIAACQLPKVGNVEGPRMRGKKIRRLLCAGYQQQIFLSFSDPNPQLFYLFLEGCVISVACISALHNRPTSFVTSDSTGHKESD